MFMLTGNWNQRILKSSISFNSYYILMNFIAFIQVCLSVFEKYHEIQNVESMIKSA